MVSLTVLSADVLFKKKKKKIRTSLTFFWSYYFPYEQQWGCQQGSAKLSYGEPEGVLIQSEEYFED